MSTDTSKLFYLFHGNWQEKFAELSHTGNDIKPGHVTIWTPKDKRKRHSLVVVSGCELPPSYCLNESIWKTDENVFESFYMKKTDNYNILSI